MCRNLSEGGRRCPGCQSSEARRKHNERRRRNRSLRREAVRRAREYGVSNNRVAQLEQGPIDYVKAWLACRRPSAEYPYLVRVRGHRTPIVARKSGPYYALWSQIDYGLYWGPKDVEVVETYVPPADGGEGLRAEQASAGRGLAVPEGWATVRGSDDKTQVLLDDLKLAVDTIAQSGQIERWLDAMATNGMSRWSANNRILALVQLAQQAERLGRPELFDQVHMMTAKQWKDRHGRWPAKGSQALYILRPRTRKIVEEDEHGNQETRVIVSGFSPVPVFNITQTDGPPLPEPPIAPAQGDVPAGMYEGLRVKVAEAGFTFAEAEIPGCDPEKGSGTLGYTDPAGKSVVVDSRLNPMAKVSTMAHELGHILAGHVDESATEYRRHRGQMETEAEAAAYLVLRRVGVPAETVEAFSPGYIAGWMAQKGASFQEAMDRAVKAADQILAGWFDSKDGDR